MAYVDYEKTDDVPYFDPSRSPAASDYGVFAEIVRTWPGAIRSENPGASTVAIGARAAWLCADHPMNYGYGKGSPLDKLVEANGKVLLLGSDLDHVTLLHYARTGHSAQQTPDSRSTSRSSSKARCATL